MTRTQYKNNHIKEHYDRINLCIPKGQKAKIRAVADNMQISVNEYIFMLICADLRNSKLRETLNKAYNFMKQFVMDGRNLLERFLESIGQVVEKVRDVKEW